jgi:hypothetical protein
MTCRVFAVVSLLVMLPLPLVACGSAQATGGNAQAITTSGSASAVGGNATANGSSNVAPTASVPITTAH